MERATSRYLLLAWGGRERGGIALWGVRKEGETHCFACIAVDELLHRLEAEDRVFDSLEEGAGPANGSCYWRLVLGERRVVFVL